MKFARGAQVLGVAAAVALPASSALAEVCDKERPDWAPADGPVGQLGETIGILAGLLSSGPGIAILAVLLLPLLWRNRGLSLASAALAALMAFGLAAAWLERDPVYEAALAEGCRTAPILPIALLALLCLWMLRRGLSRRQALENPCRPAG